MALRSPAHSQDISHPHIFQYNKIEDLKRLLGLSDTPYKCHAHSPSGRYGPRCTRTIKNNAKQSIPTLVRALYEQPIPSLEADRSLKTISRYAVSCSTKKHEEQAGRIYKEWCSNIFRDFSQMNGVNPDLFGPEPVQTLSPNHIWVELAIRVGDSGEESSEGDPEEWNDSSEESEPKNEDSGNESEDEEGSNLYDSDGSTLASTIFSTESEDNTDMSRVEDDIPSNHSPTSISEGVTILDSELHTGGELCKNVIFPTTEELTMIEEPETHSTGHRETDRQPHSGSFSLIEAPIRFQKFSSGGRQTPREVFDLLSSTVAKGSRRSGYIYMFRRPNVPNHLKIGCVWDVDASRHSPSVDVVKKRLDEWEGKCGYKPELVFKAHIPHAMQRIEALVHTTLRAERRVEDPPCAKCEKRHNEWFEVEEDRARKTVELWQLFSLQQPYNNFGRLDTFWSALVEEKDAVKTSDILTWAEDMPVHVDNLKDKEFWNSLRRMIMLSVFFLTCGNYKTCCVGFILGFVLKFIGM